MPTTDELAAQIAALQAATPTHEDLLASMTIPCWGSSTPSCTITGSTRLTLMVVPIPLRILSVGISLEYQTLAASDTNFWTCALERGSGGSYPDMALRSTQNTGANANGGITARTPWTFDAAAWASTDLAAGDLLTANWYPAGSPAALQFPQTFTIRYRPI
jgi:hypothetical protein